MCRHVTLFSARSATFGTTSADTLLCGHSRAPSVGKASPSREIWVAIWRTFTKFPLKKSRTISGWRGAISKRIDSKSHCQQSYLKIHRTPTSQAKLACVLKIFGPSLPGIPTHLNNWRKRSREQRQTISKCSTTTASEVFKVFSILSSIPTTNALRLTAAISNAFVIPLIKRNNWRNFFSPACATKLLESV